MATVTFDKATRIYPGTDKPAVDALELAIEDGEFLVLVGPSGCGKSTSLRMLAGLEEVDGGAIRIGERDVTHMPPKDRDIAMVFQNYALYPHMTVADNMGFALKIAGTPKDEIRRRVGDAAKLLDLTEYLDRKPKALSGGQRQRVRHGPGHRPRAAGVPHGRAAVEPRRQAARVHPYADRVAAAPPGHHHGLRHARPDRGHDHGRPRRRPQRGPAAAGRQPAGAVRQAGQRVRRGLHRLAGHEHRDVRRQGRPRHAGRRDVAIPASISSKVAAEGSTTVTLGFRPEALQLASAEEKGGIPVLVDVVEELGSDAYVYGRPAGPAADEQADRLRSDQVIARVEPRNAPQKGEKINFTIRPGSEHFFSAKTGERLEP